MPVLVSSIGRLGEIPFARVIMPSRRRRRASSIASSCSGSARPAVNEWTSPSKTVFRYRAPQRVCNKGKAKVPGRGTMVAAVGQPVGCRRHHGRAQD